MFIRFQGEREPLNSHLSPGDRLSAHAAWTLQTVTDRHFNNGLNPPRQVTATLVDKPKLSYLRQNIPANECG
jgi:hypothetical protein